MSDKGRQQEDRSGILKSVRGQGIPQLGASPGLVHHPPYPLPSDSPHTLSLHPAHLAYPMMRPALGMGAPMGLSAKMRGNPSNDLGPPIFMPSLNLGVPKQPSGQPSSSAIFGVNAKSKNSIVFSQSSMSSNFVSDILSNAPTPFQHMPAFHVTAATSILRQGGQPTVYIPHTAPHPSQNALRSPPQATMQSPAVGRPTPIAATNPQKPGPSKTITKVVAGSQQKPPGAVPSTVKQTLKSQTSYSAPSQSHVHSGMGIPPSAIAMATKPPTTSMSRSIAVSSPDGEHSLASMGHMTYVTHAPIPHPQMVHTIPYMPQGLVTHTLQTPHSMGSTLSKMLLAPSRTTTRQPKLHIPTESPASHTHFFSQHPPSTLNPASADGSTGVVAGSFGSHNSASPKVGTPEGYLSRSLAQPTTSLSTSGQPSSSASYTDTRLERPPQPSAVAMPQSTAAASGNFSNSTYSTAPGKDRTTCAEVASGIIITMPGLTGKHIAQITNSGSPGTSSPGGGSSPAQSVAGSSEGYRGHPLAMDPSVPQIPQANSVHHNSPSLAGGAQLLNLHQNSTGTFAQLPAAGGATASVATVSVAMAMHSQAPSVGGTGSPGQGNSSSPRPRILRKPKFESYNRKMDSQATPPSPSTSPLINKVPLGSTAKHVSGSGMTAPADHTHPMYNSTSSVGQKRPMSPPGLGSGSEGHNHLRAELGDFMASPRKKPRKQNVVANDDQYASNVPDGITSELLSGSPHLHPRGVGPGEEDNTPLISMTTRSKTRAEEALLTREAPKEVEIRYLAQLRRSPYPINGVYRVYHRAAHNHFRRHADIKHREEERASAYNIASDRSSRRRASGWKLLRLNEQLEEMSKVESEILETMQKVMECVHNLDQCASCPVDGKCLANFEELIEGNVNRSSRVVSHIDDTNAAVLKVLDHKSEVIDLLRKFSPPKKSANSTYSATNSQKSRS